MVDPDGKFKPLHKFNHKFFYIKDNIIKTFKMNNENSKKGQKFWIMDWWSLLSEPMNKLGADVVGIDTSEKNINIYGFMQRTSMILNIFVRL